MAEIHVFFPPAGPAIVRDDFVAVMPGEPIHWRFHPHRDDIAKIKIQFDAMTALFFPMSDGSLRNGMEKDRSKAHFIWGTAPDLKGGRARWDKYSIHAYDRHDVEITDAFVDPTIITEEPRP